MIFTCVFEYGGGTYVTQVNATSVNSAVKKWVHKSVAVIEQASKVKISNVVDSFGEPCPIKGMNGVWCISGFGNRGFALMNIVSSLAVGRVK